MGNAYVKLTAIFCICLMINISFYSASALTITHDTETIQVSGSDAIISWETDEQTTGAVTYGREIPPERTETTSLSRIHTAYLSNLEYDTVYYYKISATNTTNATVEDDNNGGYYSFTSGYDITDTTPPEINTTLPSVASTDVISFAGTTEPEATVRLYVNPSPEQIGGLNYHSYVTADSDGDFVFSGVRLTQEINEIVIWARDKSHNENHQSFAVRVDTLPPAVEISGLENYTESNELAVNGTVSELVDVVYTVGNVSETIENVEGDFSFVISLEEDVTNYILIQFTDEAGNVVEFENYVYPDIMPPEILQTNLQALSPTYIQEVTIRGKVNKPGVEVVVFVNNQTATDGSWSTSLIDSLKHLGKRVTGDTQYSAVSDENGSFAIDILLTQDLPSEFLNYTHASSDYEYLEYYEAAGGTFSDISNVPSNWRDVSRRRLEQEQEFENDIRIVAMDRLGRTDEVTGTIAFSKCGFGSDWNIYIDPSKITPTVITPEHLRLGIAQISFPMKLEWQGGGSEEKVLIKQAPIIRAYRISPERASEYLFNSNEILGDIQPSWGAGYRDGYIVLNLNAYDYEQANLSDIDITNLSVKLPMQIELEYEYDLFGQTAPGIQRYCFDVDVMLDVEVPDDVIPEFLLESSIDVMNATIEGINKILGPLTQVMLWTFVTCMASWLVTFIVTVKQKFSCLFPKPIGVSEQNRLKFMSCADAYKEANGGSGSPPENCEPCKSAVEARMKVETTMHWVCDRIFCPSAPTFNNYVESEEFRPEGSTCEGLKAGEVNRLEIPDMPLVSFGGTAESIEEACLLEYKSQWDSTCVFMNELTESRCLAGVEEACGGQWKSIFRTVTSAFDDVCKVNQEIGNQAFKVKPEGETDPEKWETYLVVKSDKGTCEGYEGYLVYKNPREVAPQQVVEEEPGTYTGVGTGSTYFETTETSKVKCEDYATLPDTIKSKINPLTQKGDYIVDPTSSIIRSVQCVCLPGIVGYLQLWRDILSAVRQCFQSILITGNGRTGVCRAVLTTYVCDLIYDAIRCIANKYASAGVGKEEPGGVGKFLKSASSAGADVSSSIRGRYGRGNTFKTLFNERKLVHAACLWAFTGDWDVDVAGLLTGAGAPPLKTEVFLYPRTRRFMGANPVNKGKATFVYHIGVGMIAGSELKYNLELVCSNDYSCDLQEGFPGGRCDCLDKGKEETYEITRYAGVGRLSPGDMIGPDEGDLYIRVPDADYRYDKVRLTYSYIDNEGRQQTEILEEPIQLVGGKPPADCAFDLAAGYFHCAFTIGEKGYAVFTEKPEPMDEYYYIGDELDIKFELEKFSPGYDSEKPNENVDKQIPKWLCWELRDHNGNIIRDGNNQECVKLDEDGVYTQSDEKITGIEVKKEFFTVGPTSITKSYAYFDPGFASTGKVGVDFRGYDGPDVLGIEYKSAPENDCSADKNCNFVCKRGTYNSNTREFTQTEESVSKYCCNPINEGENELICNGAKITFERKADKGLPFNEGVHFVIYKIETPTTVTEDECEDHKKEGNAAIWKARIYLVDPKKEDEEEPWSSSNVVKDPAAVVVYDEKLQDYTVDLRVVCAESKTSEEKKKEQQPCETNEWIEPGERCTCGSTVCGPETGSQDLKSGAYCLETNGEKQCVDYVECEKGKVESNEDSKNLCDCDIDRKNEMECKAGDYCDVITGSQTLKCYEGSFQSQGQ